MCNKNFIFIISTSALLALSACDSLPSWMGGAEKEFTPLPGERFDVLPAGPEFTPDEALKATSLNLPTVQENSAWQQPTGQFTAATANLALAGDLSSKQSASVGDGKNFSHTLVPRPVVGGGLVFAMDAVGAISAHDVNDISKNAWTSNALVDADENEVMGGGLAFDAGKIFAASGRGKIAALDAASGESLWNVSLGFLLRSAPRVSGDTLYVISIDSQLIAVDIATGKTRWTHRGISETTGLMNSVSPAIAADTVIAPYASGELYAIRKDNGDEIWRASLAQGRRNSATAIFAGIGGDPVVDEAVVFAVSNGGMFSVLNVLTGQPLWEKPISSINAPWVVGEYVFALSAENTLVAMRKYDGRMRWSSQFQRFGDEKRKLDPIIYRGPVMAGGKLWLTNSVGELIAIDPATGTTISQIDIADDVVTSPVVAGGKLFLVGKDATLYSFQ